MKSRPFTFAVVVSLLLLVIIAVGRASASRCETFKDCDTCTRVADCQWVQYQNCTFGCVDYYELKVFGPRLRPWRKSIGINVTSTRYTCSENLECKQQQHQKQCSRLASLK